jgi:4-amino-4-deoxychorismate lyase
MNASRRALLGCTDELRLEEVVSVPDELGTDLLKCRVTYDESIVQIRFEKYLPKTVKTLQLVRADSVRYDHKFLDRSCFNRLIQSSRTDDILIVKNGLLTDTSFANIVFLDGDRWVTPATPLLRGTKREYYLEQGRIEEAKLTIDDLPRFPKAVLINAMLDLETGPAIEGRNILPVV